MNESNSDTSVTLAANLALDELVCSVDKPFTERIRIITRHIHKFQPPKLSLSLAYCTAVNNPEACFAVESLQVIFAEISQSSTPLILPAAVELSLRKNRTGQALTDWCIFELKEFSHVLPEDPCELATRHVYTALRAISFLCALLNSPFLAINPELEQKVLRTIIITWLRTAGLEEVTLTYLYASQAIEIIGPARTAAALAKTPVEDEVTHSLLRHVVRFVNQCEHVPVERLEKYGTGRRLQFQEVMSILSMITSSRVDLVLLLALQGGISWMCRALSKVMKDSERYGWVHPSFGEICSYLYESFRQGPAYELVEIALRRRLLSSLSRCVSATVPPHHITELEKLLDYLCSVVRMHPPILRLACRAVDARSFMASDVSGWKKLDDTIRIYRQCWSVDPNAKSGRRCMSPKCTSPYARSLFKCSRCQLSSLLICSRRCQKYLWNEMGHKKVCESITTLMSDSEVVGEDTGRTTPS